MNLVKVEIHGFRSIKEMTISFNGYGHKVLVGKNESGKSNILKALNLLSGEIFGGGHKKVEHEGNEFVQFTFELEAHELQKCMDELTSAKKFIHNSGMLTSEHTVESFLEKICKRIHYRANPLETGEWKYCELDNNTEIDDGWYCVERSVARAFRFGGEETSTDSYVHKDFIKTNLDEEEQTGIYDYLSKVELSEICRSCGETIKDVLELENEPFPVIYWEYNSQDHDLPAFVNREEFSSNPGSCIPLKYMFLLSGIQEDEIHERIVEANEQGPNRLKSLLDKVSRETNKYIESNWKEYCSEYKKVKIELQKNGDNIDIGVKDSENTFDFQERSGGFRRFISFLLLMSGEQNSLILIDEPETGLHPSSAKDLRNELINLAKENIVVYATHSISMIDTENIENNLIVSKKSENTSHKPAKEHGISPAESIYQAIGFSIYENLKEVNILVEGYTDKQILKRFMTGDKWEKFGICFTEGVKNIKCVTSLLDLVGRKYFVLSDADSAAKKEKKAAANPEYWYTYQDLGMEETTIEDFYEREFFLKTVRRVLNNHHIDIDGLEVELNQYSNKIKLVKDFLNKKKIKQGISKIITEIKNQCIQDFDEDLHREKITNLLTAFLRRINSESTNRPAQK